MEDLLLGADWLARLLLETPPHAFGLREDLNARASRG